MDRSYLDATKSPKERAKILLGQMTLREKVGQLNQKLYGFWSYERKGQEIELADSFREEVEYFGGLGVLYGLYRADPWSGRTYENGLTGKYAAQAYDKVQRYVIEHSRFGIPMLLSTECPHGHQALDGYLLPVNLAAGATFDPKLMKEAARVAASQLKEMGVDLALVSMLDVLRDPRWGRSEECFGEDPYLGSVMAKAAVEGFQEEGVAVVAKHFAAQGETTGGVNASAARIGERELREIHLPPMEACCEAGVKGVMAAYNEIDGVYCHGNPHLLKTILREEMGFQGIVMADGLAVDQLNRITGDCTKSGALALRSGVDVSLWDTAFHNLDQAVEQGLVSEEEVDQAALRVLEMKFERGLFEHPYLEEKELREFSYEAYPQSLELSRESVVLLKNEGQLLPLKHPGKIAVIGPNGDDIYCQLGDYSPSQREGAGVTLFEGIQRLGKERGFETAYQKGCSLLGDAFEEKEGALKLAKESDLIVLALGGSSSRFGEVHFDANGAAISGGEVSMDCGEGVDCASLELPKGQRLLAEAVSSLGKPVITVVINGRPMALTDQAEKSQAMLQCFYPGIMGGQAIAEILFGEKEPSGRLPVSLPRATGQIPVCYNGKRSYEPKHYDVESGSLYPFGHGLSYTEFRLGEMEVTAEKMSKEDIEKQGITVSVQAENIGERPGTALVLLYLQRDHSMVVPRVRELKGFERVFLNPGEKKRVSIKLTAKELSIWNHFMKRELEEGTIRLCAYESGTFFCSKEMEIQR